MGLIIDQIQKAKKRLDFDPQQLRDFLRNKRPKDLSSGDQLEQRYGFLRRSLKDDRVAKQVFERIIDGNELMSINYLERGVRAARAVARVHVVNETGDTFGWGTGFLIAPGVFITNNHVLPDFAISAQSEAHFEYEHDIQGKKKEPVIFKLLPDQLFFTSEELDFTVVAVEQTSANRSLTDFGTLPFVGTLGKILDGEWLTIIQHPNGERKQICVRENRLLHRAKDVLWYSTDTLGGSSGAPVFNNDWIVVALHHSGIPAERNGRIQTRDGRDYDEETMDETEIHWIANEGIRTSRIVAHLKKELPTHPLLQPIFSKTSPQTYEPASSIVSHPVQSTPFTISYPIDPIQPITIPIHLNLTLIPRTEHVASPQTAPVFDRQSAQRLTDPIALPE